MLVNDSKSILQVFDDWSLDYPKEVQHFTDIMQKMSEDIVQDKFKFWITLQYTLYVEEKIKKTIPKKLRRAIKDLTVESALQQQDKSYENLVYTLKFWKKINPDFYYTIKHTYNNWLGMNSYTESESIWDLWSGIMQIYFLHDLQGTNGELSNILSGIKRGIIKSSPMYDRTGWIKDMFEQIKQDQGMMGFIYLGFISVLVLFIGASIATIFNLK